MSGGVPAGELLPCAFCGGTDLSVETYDVQPDDYHGGYVTCTDCDAQGAGAISLNGWLHSPGEARAAAITAWNTRATPTPPIEGRDADVEREAEKIATQVADRCQGKRKPGQAPQRYAIIWQAARLGARAALQALGERG